jgi:hypothetical protein
MKNLFSILFLFAGFSLTASSDVRLEGDWTCNISTANSTVHITGEKIANESDHGRSGSLILKLYLTDEKYYGGNISGISPFAENFDPLEAGDYYYDIDKTQELSREVSAGTYFITLVLLNKIEGEFKITDYLNFSNPVTFEEKGLDEARLSLIGTWTASLENESAGKINIKGGEIANKAGFANSDSLQFLVFISSNPYDNLFDGYYLAEKYFGSLESGYSYTPIDLELPFLMTPESGQYYVTLVILEKQSGFYFPVTHLELGQLTFD